MALPSRVKIVEVSPRDGLQNEKEFVPTDIKVELVDRLSAAGFPNVEAASFVSPKWVPQMADGADVMARIQRRPGTIYSVLTPNMKGFEGALAAGADEIVIFGAASEAFSQKNINCSIAESIARFEPVVQAAREAGIRVRGSISCALGCPYQGEVPIESVVDVAQRYLAMQVDEIDVADTIGVGTPKRVREVMTAVTRVVDPARVSGHFHDTYGQALANILAALGPAFPSSHIRGRPRAAARIRAPPRQHRHRRRAVHAARPGHRHRRGFRRRGRHRAMDVVPSEPQGFQPGRQRHCRQTGRMSSPGRPQREYRNAQHEDSPVSAPAGTPAPEDHAALLRAIGPLPLSGQAWPDWVRILTWIILAVLGVQVVTTAIRARRRNLRSPAHRGRRLCFLGLLLVSWNMQVSITTIDERGLRQTWFTRREVAWEDVRYARFVPMLFSKRLVVFTHRGRPMIFQGGTRELRAAFVKIAELYRAPGAEPAGRG